MRFFALIGCITIMEAACFAQPFPPDSLWSRVIVRSSYDLFGDMITLPDSGYIIVSGTLTNENNSDGWMIKVSAAGDTQWTSLYDYHVGEAFSRIKPLPDGGYILGGNAYSDSSDFLDLWLLAVDGQRDTLWSQTYRHRQSSYCGGLEVLPNGGYVIAGFSFDFGSPDSADAWLMQVDADGGLVWRETFVTGPLTTFSGLDISVDGGYVLAGRATNSENENWNGWIVRTDSAGDTLWTRRFGNVYDYFTDIKCTSDGGLVAVGTTTMYGNALQIWVVRCDAEGNLLWDRNYGDPGPDKAWTVTLAADGGYFIGGYYGTSDSPRFWVLKLDSLGILEWDLMPDPDGNNSNGGGQCQRIIETHDGGFVAGGIAHIFTSYNIGLMKYGWSTDAVNPSTPDSYSIIPSVYPNPFNAVTTVEWYQVRSGPVTVVVYDLLGRSVQTLVSEPHSPGQHKVLLDGQSLSSGSYFLSVQTPDYLYRRRVILLK